MRLLSPRLDQTPRTHRPRPKDLQNQVAVFLAPNQPARPHLARTFSQAPRRPRNLARTRQLDVVRVQPSALGHRPLPIGLRARLLPHSHPEQKQKPRSRLSPGPQPPDRLSDTRGPGRRRRPKAPKIPRQNRPPNHPIRAGDLVIWQRIQADHHNRRCSHDRGDDTGGFPRPWPSERVRSLVLNGQAPLRRLAHTVIRSGCP